MTFDWMNFGGLVIDLISLVLTFFAFSITIYTIFLMIKQTKEMTSQTQQLGKSIRLETYQRVYEKMLDVDFFFVEHPELKPYFYSGKKIEDESQREKLSSLAETIVDFFYNIYFQRDGMPKETWIGWERYIEYIIKFSPTIQEYLEETQSWYQPDFIRFLKEGIKQ